MMQIGEMLDRTRGILMPRAEAERETERRLPEALRPFLAIVVACFSGLALWLVIGAAVWRFW